VALETLEAQRDVLPDALGVDESRLLEDNGA